MFVKQFRNDNKKGLNEAPFRKTPKVNTWNLIIHLLILINDIFHQKANAELTVILKFDYLKELQDQYLDIFSRNWSEKFTNARFKTSTVFSQKHKRIFYRLWTQLTNISLKNNE